MIKVQAHQTINQATINQSNRLDHISPYAAPGWAGPSLDLHQSRCSEASSEPECRSVSSPNQTVSDTVGHGEENPIEPLPAWFRALLIGPGSDFIHLQCDIGDLDDWGLAREIARFRELDQEAAELAARVEVLHEELDATRDARTMSEKRLVLARASQKAARLENLPKKVGMLSTHSRHKNDNRCGRLV